jgi:hypothetical protein
VFLLRFSPLLKLRCTQSDGKATSQALNSGCTLFVSLSVGDLVRKISVTFAIHLRKSKQLDEKHRNKERNKIEKGKEDV